MEYNYSKLIISSLSEATNAVHSFSLPDLPNSISKPSKLKLLRHGNIIPCKREEQKVKKEKFVAY